MAAVMGPRGKPVFGEDPAELHDGRALAGALESEQQRDERNARLDALGQALAKTRSDAIQGRMQSGIEEDWIEDEEFYQGIDDANRGEHRSVWRTKPMAQASASSAASTTTRSTVFPNITGPYVDAASARIADMLLPTDDKNYSIKPTPIPSLTDLAAGKVPPAMERVAMDEAGGDEALASNKIADAVSAAMAVIDKAKAQAKKAELRIEDWLIECRYHAAVRQVIEDAGKIGTGVLKGPMPQYRKGVAYIDGQIRINREIKPGSKRINVWDFFPDPACGEAIQSGAYTWERDRLTRKQMRELKDQPQYIPEAIDECMKEGPLLATGEYTQDVAPWRVQTDDEKRGKFEVWYYHGTVEKTDLEAAGCDCEGMEDPHLPAMITMVNNRVIRASLNPLDTGSFPYDVMVWRARAGHWAGIGVARQIRTAQRIVTAAMRNLMDNAGLAAGPMLVLRQKVVHPADGTMGFGPRKVYYIAEDADEIKRVEDAIGTIKVEMLVNELMEIIRMGLKLAEDVTGLPMLLQGQQGSAPDTVGGMQMLNNNASSVLRRLAKLFDDRVTEPHITRYYEWLLQYGEDEEKGDYQIDARGSSALVERDIQNQELAGIIKLSTDMRFKIDPVKAVQEYLKSRHFDPKTFEFDDDKWQKILENLSKGPQDPRLAVAQLRAETEEKLLQMEQSFIADQENRNRALEMWVTEMEKDGTQTISLNALKTKLADTTIKVETQKQLSREGAAREALKPPTEPAKRAPKGQAFAR